jgi:beta-glucosidase/6-phospho-beta-glucosidase/beta-galactosidase
MSLPDDQPGRKLSAALRSDFHYGYASASYQIEGAIDVDGRGQTQWDIVLAGQENGSDACDSYHQWEQDVRLLQEYGANSYRFSIAWPRIIPNGTYWSGFIPFNMYIARIPDTDR